MQAHVCHNDEGARDDGLQRSAVPTQAAHDLRRQAGLRGRSTQSGQRKLGGRQRQRLAAAASTWGSMAKSTPIVVDIVSACTLYADCAGAQSSQDRSASVVVASPGGQALCMSSCSAGRQASMAFTVPKQVQAKEVQATRRGLFLAHGAGRPALHCLADQWWAGQVPPQCADTARVPAGCRPD